MREHRAARRRSPRFQPQPSRNSASSRTMPPSAGAAAAISEAVASTTVPAKIVGTAPKRSVSRPETGDSANIPSVCADRTMPTAVRSWPCSVMWSGVIVMIRTITSWPTTSAMIAAATAGRRRISAIGPTLGARVVAGRQARGLVRELVRVGAEQGERTGSRRGRRTRSGRGTGRPARQARLDREVARDRHHRRADHRPDGRAPDHDADRRRAPVGGTMSAAA